MHILLHGHLPLLDLLHVLGFVHFEYRTRHSVISLVEFQIRFKLAEFGVRDLLAIVLLDRVLVLEKFFLAEEFRHGEDIVRLGVCVPSRAFEQARFKATREDIDCMSLPMNAYRILTLFCSSSPSRIFSAV